MAIELQRIKKSRYVCVLLVGALVLVGCGRGQDGPAPGQKTASAEARELLEEYVAKETRANPAKVNSSLRRQLEVRLSQLQAAAAKAESLPGIKPKLELARLELLAHAGAAAAGVYTPPTEIELRQEYARYQQTLPAREYHAAHILVANEILATAIIAELDSGKAFADVARLRSADDSRNKGGDLGWISPGHLPAEFFAVLKALKPGEYARRPIHTAYGWHVIRLLDVRAAEPPAFEQVRAQLAAEIQQERYQNFLASYQADQASAN